MIQLAAEKEHSHEASYNALCTIKRMQFTFSIDHPTPAVSQPIKEWNLRLSATRLGPRGSYDI